MTSASEDFALRQRGDNGRGRLVLVLGLVLGAVAAGLVAVVLVNSDDTPAAIAPSVPVTRLAVAAVEDIPPRTRITPAMVEVKTYNLTDVDPEAFTAISQLTNRVTAVEIKAGEVVVPAAVSSTTGEGLNFTVSDGMRAVSIGVSEVVIAGGNISPDDRVDVIGFFKVAREGDAASIMEAFTGEPFLQSIVVPEEATLTFTILQNVRVLAVAQDLSPEAERPSGETSELGAIAERETEANRANPKAATVTLEVSPQQAQSMATADLLGTLRLSLRPFGDDELAEVSPIVLLLED
jgi:pilus assembly protein CpaB